MRFDILTLFPAAFDAVLGDSIIGRAQEAGLITVNTINIRDYTVNKHKKVDDYPYGGGTGLLMTVQPIYDAYLSITGNMEKKPHVIYMSPQGRQFNQEIARELYRDYDHLVILCGHYEGIDERVIEEIVDEEISIGDYVLTGGELPAMVMVDCISRLVPGVLSSEESYSQESHFNGLLEYPQYTRPEVFNGRSVPEILLSGHHANIAKWRRQQSLERTYRKRPDMLKKAALDRSDLEYLKKYRNDNRDSSADLISRTVPAIIQLSETNHIHRRCF